MIARRTSTLKEIADLCEDSLEIDDPRDGWPARATVRMGEHLYPVALHVGRIGLTGRQRDEVERRFQNPAKGHPVVDLNGHFPLLIGLWDEEQRPVLVGMDTARRVGKETRQSLFVGLSELRQAAVNGWAEYHSASEEVVIAFAPALLPTYVAERIETTEVPAGDIQRAIEASGMTEEDTDAARDRARRATSRLVRHWAFGRALIEAYEGFCAMCGVNFGLLSGAHIYPVSAPDSPDTIWNGLALCGNHHSAFDKHVVWVNPSTLELTLHPLVLEGAEENYGCRAFASTTLRQLREPTQRNARPRPEMFEKRYQYYGDRYNWAS